VGGYVGIFSLFFALNVGLSGKVITFEPNPRNYFEIEENKRLNNLNNIHIKKIGVGRKKENKKLFFRKYNTATGSMEDKIKSQIIEESTYEYIDVGVYSLDNYIKEQSLPLPDFVKIDVEGMEYDVLLGMKGLLKSTNLDYLSRFMVLMKKKN